MKVVQWDDDTVPSVIVVDDGTILVEDSKYEFDLEEGDLIQYLTEIGTSCYIVSLVEKVDDHHIFRSTNICTIEVVA